MRDRKIIFLIMLAVLLAAFPLTASANSVAPDPNDHEILIDDVSDIEQITFYGYLEDGSREVIEQFSTMDDERMTRTRVASERLVELYNDGGMYSGFSVEIVFEDGSEQQSAIVEFLGEDSYVYSVSGNEFELKGTFKTLKPGGFDIALWVLVLVLPWGLTVLLEWLMALIFKIKPSRYVCFTNLVSNPVMNIVLLIVMSNLMISYFWVVLVLEVLAAGFEYLFYIFRYKDIGKVRLLLFTITANAVSFGAYAIINGLF